MDRTLGIKKASQLLDLSEGAVRHLVSKGAIRCYRDDSNRRRFYLNEIRRLVKQRKREASHA